jgi:S1-C subfamily serine protease
MAKNVMTQLIDNGQVRRGMLGVTIQPVTSDIARSLGLEHVRGALVNTVEADSPAEKAGLKRGDVITAINGETVRDDNSLRNEVSQLAPGSAVKVTVLRGGKEQTLSATLAERQKPEADPDARGSRQDSSGLGLSVEPLTRESARELGVSASAGVVVVDVLPGSRAAEAGLREGDVIAEVDGKPVGTASALRGAIADGSRPALMLVHRGERTMFLTMERR